MSEVSENSVAPSIVQFQRNVPPDVCLDSFVGDESHPDVLFSIRIPAQHQAKSLSIVRMQDCDLTHLLQDAKMDHRNMTKFVVSTETGAYTVKLHFLLFPNKSNDIQIDYTYTVPETFGALSVCRFTRSKEIKSKIGQRIHDDPFLRQGINDFATLVHGLVCEFIDRIYFDSIAAGKEPDFLITTPQSPQINLQ